MSKTTELRFDSARDPWIGLLLVFAVVMIGTGVVAAFKQDPQLASHPWVLAMPLLAMGLVIWIWTSTYYRLDANYLLIRCGPLRRRVPLERIVYVGKPGPWLRLKSSPALSLDRLQIRYGRFRWVLISPQGKSVFLRALQERAPQLHRQGEALTAD